MPTGKTPLTNKEGPEVLIGDKDAETLPINSERVQRITDKTKEQLAALRAELEEENGTNVNEGPMIIERRAS